METFVNKVAESGILTLDLAKYMPADDEILGFDMKPFLYREMILREKDYRDALKMHNWEQYSGKLVPVYCSVDAIIPLWAFMLATVHLQPLAKWVYFGTAEDIKNAVLLQGIQAINLAEYDGQRVVLKGCGEIAIPAQGYVAATERLLPVVRSLMFGEPCSTVPVYKTKMK